MNRFERFTERAQDAAQRALEILQRHATHFRVLSRSGGRNRVMPWEEGLKDTVLLHPDETVNVAIRFTAHRGLFPIHCHILEHEDVGMMLNVLVE